MLDFAPLYSTPSTDGVAGYVARTYALSGQLKCKLLHRGMNDVFSITVEDKQKFVFRLSHRRARGVADVRTETEFLSHLARSGIPVASPVPAQNGALHTGGKAPEGFREGVLFAAADGRMPDMRSAVDARANGVTLARIHNASEAFDPAGACYRLDLDHLMFRPLARILDSGIVEEASVCSDFEAIAGRTASALDAFSALTQTFCHGDCHGMNAHINDEGDAVFFDFDDGGPGYLAYDLAVFLWAKVSFDRTLFPMWNAFLDGYRAVRSITPHDFEAVHWFVIVRHIWLMGEHASRASEWGINSVGWIPGEIKFLKRWEAERLTGRLF